MRGTVRRAGLVLNTAFACLLLLTLFFAAYFLYVRNQTRLTQGVLSGEKAYHLAQGGVSIAIGYFANTKDPSKLYREILSGRLASELNGMAETLPADAEAVQRLILATRGECSLVVEMVLLGFKTFALPDPSSGVAADPVEKKGILKIISTGDFAGSRRRVVAFKEVKVVNVLPYVVSKFTLFASDRAGGEPLNRIKLKKVDLVSATVMPENRYAPLYLKNGAARNAEDNGWVFLGGDKWKFNLSWGEGKWGDQFQLLRRPWELTRASSTATPLAATYRSLLLQRGMFEGIKTDNRLFNAFDFDAPYDASDPGDDPVTEDGGLLRPYGAAPAQSLDTEIDVSPTYIMGAVSRRYLQLRYVKRVTDGRVVYTPCAPESPVGSNTSTVFDLAPSGPWVAPLPVGLSGPPPWDVKATVFAGAYPFYKEYMSVVEEEPFNRAADFLADPQEVDPPHALAPVKLAHTNGTPNFLYDKFTNDGNVVIKNAAGRQLFRGALNQIVSEDLRIPERATFVGDASGFPEWLRRNPKTIPGIVYFTGGDIAINRPLAVKSGGIVAADGNITISAPVTADAAGLPLSIVSLTGNIQLQTSSPVQASLVALRGAVGREPGSGTVVIRGNVVAGRLSLGDLCEGSEAAKIVYDTRLDPTVAGAELKSYSVQLSPWRTDYMPPAE